MGDTTFTHFWYIVTIILFVSYCWQFLIVPNSEIKFILLRIHRKTLSVYKLQYCLWFQTSTGGPGTCPTWHMGTTELGKISINPHAYMIRSFSQHFNFYCVWLILNPFKLTTSIMQSDFDVLVCHMTNFTFKKKSWSFTESSSWNYPSF